jgi:hypothetical protein
MIIGEDFLDPPNREFWASISHEQAEKYKIELRYLMMTDDGEHTMQVIETKDMTTQIWICHNGGKDHN